LAARCMYIILYAAVRSTVADDELFGIFKLFYLFLFLFFLGRKALRVSSFSHYCLTLLCQKFPRKTLTTSLSFGLKWEVGCFDPDMLVWLYITCIEYSQICTVKPVNSTSKPVNSTYSWDLRKSNIICRNMLFRGTL
jgi:hypothetical protein